ncbi:MAG TPA: Xaa-Pro peptidase family protein [Baekduia sp.]|nr:Xaa-Pro peptidase family protein [Baekduia sp.]
MSEERTTWYATGFGTINPIGSLARPRVLVVDRHGVRFHVHRSTARTVEEMVLPAIEVAPYQPLGAPVADLAAHLRAIGARRVGIELAGRLEARLGHADVATLARGLELVDAAPLVWSVRAVKSPAELERIRAACAITDRAYEAGFSDVREGMTEAEIAGVMTSALRDAGAHDGWSACVIGAGEYDRVDGVPRNRPVVRGELVFVDMGANVGGYWADFSRSGVVGEPTAHQQARQTAIHEVTAAGVAALRPGARACDVAREIDARMAERGLPFNNIPDRYGHGLGMVVTEPPDIWVDDDTVLRAGMVITIEPGTLDRHGIYHCEENVLVTDAEPELLSRADWRLRGIG